MLGFESLFRCQEKSRLRKQSAFFSYIRLRRVLLLRSDIRLLPSDIRFASFGGEYNITVSVANNITFAKQKYHADEVSISLKLFTTRKSWSFFSYIRLRRVLCTSCVILPSAVICASRVRSYKANIISLRNEVEQYHFCKAKISR